MTAGVTHREDPLHGKRSSPGPFCRIVGVAVCSSSDDYAADGPTHLKGGRQGTTKRQRHNLAGVGGRVCDEDTPGNAFKGLADNEDLK